MTSRATNLSKVYSDMKSASEQQAGDRDHHSRPRRTINEALAADLIASGIDPACIKSGQEMARPARYAPRPYEWGLTIKAHGIPRVAVDWKIVTFTHSIDLKIEHVMGLATDLRGPFEAIGASKFRPALAPLFIIDINSASTEARPYLEILRDNLREMIFDRILSCACVLYFDPETKRLIEVHDDLSFAQFAAAIDSHTRVLAAGQTIAPESAFALGQLLSLGDATGVATGLASTAVGLSAVEAAVIASRRQTVADLQSLAATNGTTETDMHKSIASNYWIFGGQYIGIASRRNLTLLDQHDYPLLCADGSLQVVELKGPECTLIRKHRNHYIVSDEVHEATSQCLNYLRSLDEEGFTAETILRKELNVEIDFRRARGTVVIGHPGRGKNSKVSTSQITQTIRSYNAHLSRIQVITYSELLESADRALRFERFAGDATEAGA